MSSSVFMLVNDLFLIIAFTEHIIFSHSFDVLFVMSVLDYLKIVSEEVKTLKVILKSCFQYQCKLYLSPFFFLFT